MGKKLLLSVDLHADGQKFDVDVAEPATDDEFNIMTQAAAQAMVAVAMAGQEASIACHPGCAFAAMIELAHKYFHDQNPVEYERIVRAEILTPATCAGQAH